MKRYIHPSSDLVAVALDQYYTRPDIAAGCYAVFKQYFDPSRYQIVEPSAGSGSFFRLLPAGSIGYDLDPKHPDVRRADFLKVTFPAIAGSPSSAIRRSARTPTLP